MRTVVGGVYVSRMIIGTNWLLGYSHASRAKSHFITEHQTRERIASVLEVFLQNSIDVIMGPSAGPDCALVEAIKDAKNRTGRGMILIISSSFSTTPGRDSELEAEKVFDQAANLGATFCFPHQCVTDVLLDRMTRTIRHMDRYTAMIREREMIPGLSTYAPEAIIYADNNGLDVESYVQICNSSGFLMQVEADWIVRVIQRARKPVMIIKPLAAGRIIPPVGLAFVWNTICDKDMVSIGTTTPDEAKEVIDISRDYLERRSSKI